MRLRPTTAAARTLARGSRRYALVSASQGVQLGSAFVLTLLLTRSLGPARFGAFAFFVAALGVLGNFSEWGFFGATSRLIARSDDKRDVAHLIGGSVLLAGLLYVVFDILVAILGLIAKPVFGIPIGTPTLIAAPLAGGFGLDLAMLMLCQGTGRHDLIVLNNLIARPLPVLVLGPWSLVSHPPLAAACALYVTGPTLAAAAILTLLRPRFEDVRGVLRRIRAELKRAGDFGSYLGRAVGTSAYGLDRILIGLFLTTTSLSYYALAFSFVAPITLGAQSLGWLSYKRFARDDVIPMKLVAANVAWLVASATGVYAIVWVLLHTILPAYKPALAIMIPVLATGVTMGAIQLPNFFLMAQGKGHALRDMNLLFAALNVVLNCTLIPLAGIQGAAWGSLFAACFSLTMHIRRYRSVRGRVGPPAVPQVAAG